MLATLDDRYRPHLDHITFLQGAGSTQIKLCLFSEPGKTQFFEKRPEADFLALSSDMRWLRGSLHYTRSEECGVAFNARENNAPLGFSRVYFFDLISIEEIRKLRLRDVLIGGALSRVKANLASASARNALSGASKLLFAEKKAYKFLCWKEDNHLSDIVPVLHAAPAGTDRVVFSSMPYGEDFVDADKGAKAAILCVNKKMKSVLVKGELIAKGVFRIEQVIEGRTYEHSSSRTGNSV